MQEYQVRGELREEQRGRGGETIQGAARDPGGIHPGTPSQSSHKKKTLKKWIRMCTDFAQKGLLVLANWDLCISIDPAVFCNV